MGALQPTGALRSSTLSRKQWAIFAGPSSINIESIGRRGLLHNGQLVDSVDAVEGDVVSVEGVVSFLVERRPVFALPVSAEAPEFGAADRAGMVGEHPHSWELRRTLELVGRSGHHVIVLGESGVGKELAARALHRHSDRAQKSLIARNAASIPESLVESEFFGHAANYPNQGMPVRPGLIGSAHGGTLFLDEIAELSELQQSNLLRVLDQGEYQRLGEDRVRRSDLRLIAATNRPAEFLKADFLARFSERVRIPGLNERRSDIPLLVQHLLSGTLQSARRPNQALVESLVRHEYTVHTRELERLLRLCLRVSEGESIAPSKEFQAELCFPEAASSIDEAAVRKAVDSHSTLTAAASSLGLSSRFVLHRLMKKWGIEKDSCLNEGQ